MDISHSNLMKQLLTVRRGELESICRKIPQSFESRKGVSQVTVFREEGAITLFERGKWLSIHTRQEISYTTSLRFRFQKNSDRIALEHLRYGKNRPILLFELDPIGPNTYRSYAPHACNEDIYTGSILLDTHYIHLNWQITGPKKNTSLKAVYTS